MDKMKECTSPTVTATQNEKNFDTAFNKTTWLMQPSIIPFLTPMAVLERVNSRCGASLGGTLDYIPNPTLRLKKRRVFTFTIAFLRSTNVGTVCDPSIEFIINRP